MDNAIKDILGRGNRVLDQRDSLLSLWQTLSELFYPERADFTVQRFLGDEMNNGLYTSYPIMVRRDLGNAFSTMLRPKEKEWYRMEADANDIDHAAKIWLHEKSNHMYKIMYRKGTGFVRRTKELDHDFATFGQGVMQLRPTPNYDNIYYETHHLKNVGWMEGFDGEINEVHRKQNIPAAILIKVFGSDNVSQKVRDCCNDAKKDPYTKINCRHAMIPVEEYHDDKYSRFKWVSYWIDVENEHIMEERGSNRLEYIIPRWATVAGSQYAHSPASITARPDAEVINQMSATLLEAGEKTVNPPLVGVEEMITSPIDNIAGGMSWIDAEYDGRLEDVLRPIQQNYSGIPVGLEMLQDSREMIASAFYLDKLTLPPAEHEMTATEVTRRVEEYVRKALPLFEPLEENYNAALCEETFKLLFEMGAFGSTLDVPKSLLEAEVEFKFESPLHDSIEEMKASRFVQAAELLRTAVELDASATVNLNVDVALREAFEGIKVNPEWMPSEEEVIYQKQQIKQQNDTMNQLEAAKQATEVMGNAGQATQALQAAEG